MDRNHQHKHVNLILVLLLLAAIFSRSQNSPSLISISQVIQRNPGTIGTQDTTKINIKIPKIVATIMMKLHFIKELVK